MANPLYKVTLDSNFEFSKVSKNFKKVMQDSSFAIISDFAEATAKNISDGKLRGLSQNTKELRKRGLSTFPRHNKSKKPDTKGKPLLYTGALRDSIKAKKDGIEMLHYGVEHNKGFDTPEGKFVPPRNFIVGTKDLKRNKDAFNVVSKEFAKNIERAMKK